jgi:hypothetical protein
MSVSSASRESATGKGLRCFGAALLALMACIVMALGLAVAMYPAEYVNPRPAADHVYGLLITLAGIALADCTCRMARKLGMGPRIRELLELPLILGAVFGGLLLVVDLLPLSRRASDGSHTQPLPGGGLWLILAATEAIVGLVWLAQTNRAFAKRAQE